MLRRHSMWCCTVNAAHCLWLIQLLPPCICSVEQMLLAGPRSDAVKPWLSFKHGSAASLGTQTWPAKCDTWSQVHCSLLGDVSMTKLRAQVKPNLPVAQPWFKATAVGSSTDRKPQLPTDDSQDQAAVAASDYSCQVRGPHIVPAVH